MPYLSAREIKEWWPAGYCSPQNVHSIAKAVDERIRLAQMAEDNENHDVAIKLKFKNRFGKRHEQD